uniref:tRNA methyltransferase 10 homolog C n=1 Tax=Callorhinchus milii TaxID=7868 RepID=V9KT63_CALMI
MWLHSAKILQSFNRCYSLRIKTGVKIKMGLSVFRSRPLCRTLFFTPYLKNEERNVSTDKLDLDSWKTVMRENVVEEVQPSTSENLEDSPLAATRELVEMWRLAGKQVPENMTEEHLKNFEELPTKSSKKKYLKFLSIKEGIKKNAKIKKEKLRQDRADQLEKAGDSEEEQEMKNSFFLQFWQRSFNVLHNWRAAQSMIHGQPLVFDMSYDKQMGNRELVNTVSQLIECEGWNRRSLEPFHLHFCNISPGGSYHKELLKRYGATWDKLLITVTEKSYIDIFPRNKLVYLTADSPRVMKTFDHDKIYIIGSIVDRSIQTGLSLANAKRLNLATERLPLDEYLKWEIGAKNLTLNQMINIMLSMKDTGRWEEALKFVPKRKHEGFVQNRKEKILYNDKKKRCTPLFSRTENYSNKNTMDYDREMRHTQYKSTLNPNQATKKRLHSRKQKSIWED